MQFLVPDFLLEEVVAPLRSLNPEVQVFPITVDGERPRGPETLDEVEAIFVFYPPRRFEGKNFERSVLPGILRAAPRLRWVHSGLTGVENILVPPLSDNGLPLTCSAGAPKRPIAETALAYILADAKALVAHQRNQQRGLWKYEIQRELPGLTVAVLGLGNIGLEIARLCRALDLRVIGTKRTPEPLEGVEEVFPPERQNECVAQADWVVVASALTAESRGMVNASTFAAMKPGAALINISRGAIVNEPDLLEALRSERIRAAYLDVFAIEPLPEDSPLWSHPNVVVTPHNSSSSQRQMQHTLDIFYDNFRRFCAGEPLRNVVDKQRGY